VTAPRLIIGPDIVGRVFTKATFDVTLPSGKTLNDLDWVSIWCVKAAVSFGSGRFCLRDRRACRGSSQHPPRSRGVRKTIAAAQAASRW